MKEFQWIRGLDDDKTEYYVKKTENMLTKLFMSAEKEVKIYAGIEQNEYI